MPFWGIKELHSPPPSLRSLLGTNQLSLVKTHTASLIPPQLFHQPVDDRIKFVSGIKGGKKVLLLNFNFQ